MKVEPLPNGHPPTPVSNPQLEVEDAVPKEDFPQQEKNKVWILSNYRAFSIFLKRKIIFIELLYLIIECDETWIGYWLKRRSVYYTLKRFSTKLLWISLCSTY